MTAAAYLVIRCDGPDPAEPDGRCGSEGHWPLRVDTHRELRRLLRTRCSWRRTRDGRDLCPACAGPTTAVRAAEGSGQ